MGRPPGAPFLLGGGKAHPVFPPEFTFFSILFSRPPAKPTPGDETAHLHFSFFVELATLFLFLGCALF
jgi:hypothetical protein